LCERVKVIERRGVQFLTVLAEHDLFLPGGEVPYPVLADSAGTVSASYGVAFQARTWRGWSARSVTFVIDREGIIRSAGDRPESDLLQVVIGLEEERGLIEALKDKGTQLRQAAVVALSPIGPDTRAVIPALLKALEDNDASARSGAAAALNWIAPQAGAVVPALVKAVADRDGRVRRLAAGALGRTGPAARAAIPALIEALKDSDERVRRWAAAALKCIDPTAAERAGVR